MAEDSSPPTINGDSQQISIRAGGGGNGVPELANKTKRVRTGCLTCRTRHLKCDEGTPDCHNCRKSNRLCRRGVRLNFIDTKINDPYIVPPAAEWKVQFQDESREIAGDYVGGRGEYAALDEQLAREQQREQQRELKRSYQQQQQREHHQQQQQQQQNHQQQHQQQQQHQHQHQHQQSDGSNNHNMMQSDGITSLPPIHPMLYETQSDLSSANDRSRHNSIQMSESYSHTPQSANFHHSQTPVYLPPAGRKYLDQPNETLYMQVFVEEVGIWMDSMDPAKHFSRLIPFRALDDPMLFNALLSCGARHLSLVNPEMYKVDKASGFYETATSLLLTNLNNPARDTVACATTAVILNVYELMTEKAKKRLMHIAGARALIKECGWNARAHGIGAACFWLNIGMEVLSCLHFGWIMAWDPDDWGLDMDFSGDQAPGREELWTYRMLYILGKLCHLKHSEPNPPEMNPLQEQIRINAHVSEWRRLSELADAWEHCVPRTMQPLAYLYPYQSPKKSAFPEVWLVKRTTVVARLFYHTAMCLICETNPTVPLDDPYCARDRLHHAHQVCGIVAHIHDRGLSSVALRSMAIAAECLSNRREQQEVWDILIKTRAETGWGINFLFDGLRKKWGRENDQSLVDPVLDNSAALQKPAQPPQQQQQQQSQQSGMPLTLSLPNMHPPPNSSSSFPNNNNNSNSGSASNGIPPFPTGGTAIASFAVVTAPIAVAVAPVRRLLQNPMYVGADFSLAQHPYQSHYVPPIAQHGGGGGQQQQQGDQGMWNLGYG